MTEGLREFYANLPLQPGHRSNARRGDRRKWSDTSIALIDAAQKILSYIVEKSRCTILAFCTRTNLDAITFTQCKVAAGGEHFDIALLGLCPKTAESIEINNLQL